MCMEMCYALQYLVWKRGTVLEAQFWKRVKKALVFSRQNVFLSASLRRTPVGGLVNDPLFIS